ncbi:unnamed protein product [Spirodela intermedia]|uniref:Uncharacterized protein n=1 Tax=Spirodela intermedia TaxID=51605 RepID=A0A7I8JSG2_SPIIN|nr:unnamed protein product [Spirodela intermedia]CAA6672701.1 unnamed protein product [Spirodela intermedia]
MAGTLGFREGETVVDESLGYPRAYPKLCRSTNTYSRGPPHVFQPYALQPQEIASMKEFNRMFPVVDPERNSTADPETYINLLWKQLSHLGNAGFDPALFRVDPYGNVLYLHADPSSPLSWGVDHWFPCKRGGRTVLSNLRLVQWQVCKKKKNKLEFLVPWWDLQLGVSVNQFLSIFASSNSDFRNRAFSFLFKGGEDEVFKELNITESPFTQQFLEKKRLIGLAPAAITGSQKYSDRSVLKSVNHRSSRLPWPSSPSLDDGEGFCKGIHRSRARISKENEDPNIYSNEYLSIAMARDSLREMEEAKRKQAAIRGLDEEMKDLSGRNEEERVTLQDLEVSLIRKRRRVEKCRRLAEAQASYRSQLERMIRDAMHQCVVYKEQARLNQAACSALAARLEAQKAMCDTSEKELLKRFKVREELERQIVPDCDEQQQTRKRADDGRGDVSIGLTHSSRRKMRRALRKELRVFLEEEQKASEAGISIDEDIYMERCSAHGDEPEEEEEEQRMSQIGKRNVEKWLQMLLEKSENQGSPTPPPPPENRTDEIVIHHRLNSGESLQKLRLTPKRDKGEESAGDVERSRSLVGNKRVERRVMIARPDSPRSSRVSFPSSPLNLRRTMDCIRKRSSVAGDDDDTNCPNKLITQYSNRAAAVRRA